VPQGYSAKELSTWRRTLDHFDGIKVGLTATPAAHTMAYFEQIAYRYDYERAVQEAPCCARLGPRESADCPRRRAGAWRPRPFLRLRFFCFFF